MIKNIFPLLLLFILVSPISRTQQKDGETFPLHNFKTLVTLSSQSSKILADFQGKNKKDTQRNESSPRNNRINNLKIISDVKESMNSLNKSSSEIEKKALIVPQKTSRAFLMLVHPIEEYNRELYQNRELDQMKNGTFLDRELYQHLIVDRVIRLPFLPAITRQMHLYEWVEVGI